jgi:hypothetical protein
MQGPGGAEAGDAEQQRAIGLSKALVSGPLRRQFGRYSPASARPPFSSASRFFLNTSPTNHLSLLSRPLATMVRALIFLRLRAH